ncbi:MFS transporter [Pseudomonas sp. P7759]|uniref:MFS transporter n=1 Tax=Pseudomonas sp. P7759 TaxID=2738831 RepID=UPI0021090902|nr:MFS transporter [Pseudomonas sp. P7759]
MIIVAGAAWWWLVLVYLMFGVGIGASRPCAQVLLVNLLPKEALVAGNGAMSFIDNLAAVILPATVGVLIILWDPVWGILIDGITFFCAAIFTASLPDMEAHDSDEMLTLRAAFNGMAVICRHPTLTLGFAATLVVNVLCFPVFLVVAPYAVSARFGDAMWAICLAASGAGACIGSVVTVLAAGHQRLNGLAVISGLILSAAMVLLGIAGAAWIIVLGAVLVGFVEASWLTGWATSMQILSPQNDLGKVVAMDTFITNGAYPFIYLGSGLVAGVVGYPETLIIVAIICAMGTAGVALASALQASGSGRVPK